MAADDYMQLRSEIKQKFYGRFENKESSIGFATNGTIKEILSDEELGKLYDSLKCAAIRRLPENQQSFIKAIKNRMLYEFLAVLLFSECSLQAAEAFVKEMVIGVGAKDQRSRGEQPHYLPRTFDDLKTLFGDEMDARRFDEAQHRFCVIVVGHRDVVTIKAHDKRSLPWIDDLKEKPLGSGAYGVVRKVIIPPGHFTTDGNFGQFNSDRMSVALKSFTNVKSKKDFQQEVENILKILDSTATHKNILTSLAAIAKETESPSFYLLMPLAEMDLKSYMEKDPKMDVTFKASLISSAMGLADGLNFLHNLVYDSPDQSTICYHLDLKPDNVLLFKKHPGSSNDDAMIWKLSDFGISRIKIMEKEKKKEDLFNNPFKTETSQSGAVGASATHNVRGLSTFLPPEAGSQRQEMTEKSDIWSLGCIISVLFTYMAHGPQGVEQYSRDRMKQSNTPFDTFWQLRLITGLNFNKAVSSKHKSLIKEAYERNTTEADAVSSMLEFLEEKVLRTDKQKRCTAGQIREKLRKTCEAYSPEQAAAGSGSNSIKSGRERIEE
ncbi:serine/threonine protein kinase [Fusarium proliferatum]|nr:serine/threonine protein kinase [Fusarium proliferatum]